jgi:hypothetical protein
LLADADLRVEPLEVRDPMNNLTPCPECDAGGPLAFNRSYGWYVVCKGCGHASEEFRPAKKEASKRWTQEVHERHRRVHRSLVELWEVADPEGNLELRYPEIYKRASALLEEAP